MKIILRIIITILVIVLLFSFGIIPIFSQMIIAKHSIPEIKDKMTDLAEKRLEVLEDLVELSQLPHFEKSPWKVNFQPFIEAYVGFLPAEGVPDKGLKQILDIIDRERLSTSSEGQLLNFLTYPEWADIDISWLDKIHDFDHWNLFASDGAKKALGALKDQNYMQQIEELEELQVSKFFEFRSLLSVRLAQHIQKNDVEKAYRLLRKAIQLAVHSTSVFAMMFAADLMLIEGQLQRTYPLKGFEALDREQIQKFRRSRFYSLSMIHSVFFKELPNSFAEVLNKQMGICSVLASGYQPIISNKYFFAHPKMLETDFTSHLKRENEFFVQWLKTCGLDAFIPLMEQNKASESLHLKVEHDLGKETQQTEKLNISRIPYIRIPMHFKEIRKSIEIYAKSSR